MSGALPQLLPEPSATYEGCTHYKRKCHLLAPCCGEFFACRFCHDEVKDDNERDAKKAHKLERKLVTRVRCMRCGTQQKSQQTCESCGVTMGEYYCGICNLFDDQVSKGLWHCEGCGICRVGGQSNFFHCEGCASCLAMATKSSHKCLGASSGLHQNCPVCLEYMHTSRECWDWHCPVCLEYMHTSRKECTIMRCGHAMHVACHAEYCKTNYKCPFCQRSIGDMSVAWSRLDAEVARTHMPPEYRNTWIRVLCNDCNRESDTRWSVVAHKCRADEEIEEQAAAAAYDTAGAAGSGAPAPAGGAAGNGGSLAAAAAPTPNQPLPASPPQAERCGSYNTRKIGVNKYSHPKLPEPPAPTQGAIDAAVATFRGLLDRLQAAVGAAGRDHEAGAEAVIGGAGAEAGAGVGVGGGIEAAGVAAAGDGAAIDGAGAGAAGDDLADAIRNANNGLLQLNELGLVQPQWMIDGVVAAAAGGRGGAAAAGGGGGNADGGAVRDMVARFFALAAAGGEAGEEEDDDFDDEFDEDDDADDDDMEDAEGGDDDVLDHHHDEDDHDGAQFVDAADHHGVDHDREPADGGAGGGAGGGADTGNGGAGDRAS